MNVSIKRFLPALALCLGCTFASAQTTLISDSFSTEGELHGSTPGTTVNSAAWNARTGTYAATSNGSVLSLPTAVTQANVIDLGGTYFSTNAGIYTLSLDVRHTSGSAIGWIGLGFVVNPVTTGSLSNNATVTGLNPNGGNNGGAPWMLLRENGQANVYRGAGATNSLVTGTVGTFATETTYKLTLVLNTSLTNWTLDSYVGSTQLDLNGVTAGNTAVLASNPTDIRYVGFSTAGGDFGTVTLDNFLLTYTAIPEPGHVALVFSAVAGLGALLWKKRRSPAR